MTLFALGLSYKGELLLAFEFAVFSGRFKFFVSSRDQHFMTSTPGARDSRIRNHQSMSSFTADERTRFSLLSEGDNDPLRYV